MLAPMHMQELLGLGHRIGLSLSLEEPCNHARACKAIDFQRFRTIVKVHHWEMRASADVTEIKF
jgi:hypothetical protein